MKIVFEETDYSLDTLNDLKKKYPEAGKLIQFIKGWENGDLNFEFQTSGSTGTPKSIIISRGQITASVQATSEFLNLNNKQQALICLDPNFVASIMMIARCLINGMNCILSKPSSNPLQSIQHRIDFASFVPFQIYKMIENKSIGDLAAIKNILIGGAPLTPSAFNHLSSLNTNIFVTYGMTETVSHIALMSVKGKYLDAFFEVLPGIQIGQDDEGCLNIIGKITNGLVIQTNDFVEIFEGNKFHWLGRRDFVINSGGIKIHPELLEKCIDAYISSDYIVSWRHDFQLGSECILIFEGEQLSKDQKSDIERIVKDEFSKFHIPKHFIGIETFERTASGKIKREETRKKALGLL